MKNWQGKLLPQRGDVIRSPKFSFGYYSPDGKTICVDGKSKTHPVVRKIVMEEKEETGLFEASARTTMYREVDVGAYDESRGAANFVVERTESNDSLRVTARRLSPDGRYNPDGEEIVFYILGCLHDTIEEIEIVGKMQLSALS